VRLAELPPTSTNHECVLETIIRLHHRIGHFSQDCSGLEKRRVSGIFLPFGMGVFFCTIGLCLRLFEGAVEPSPPDLTISCAIFFHSFRSRDRYYASSATCIIGDGQQYRLRNGLQIYMRYTGERGGYSPIAPTACA